MSQPAPSQPLGSQRDPESQSQPMDSQAPKPEYEAPAWLGDAAARGFLVTRSGGSSVKLASEDALKVLHAAMEPWRKIGREKTPYTGAKVIEIPDVDNACFLSLEPADSDTDVAALANWLVSDGAETWAKSVGKSLHVSRMIPVEAACGEMDIVPMAANVLPEHFEAVLRTGLRSSTYEVLYEEHKPSVHLLPSVVNAAIGECMHPGYQIDLKAPSHSILVCVLGSTAFMSVVDGYRQKSKHFALHKALAAMVA